MPVKIKQLPISERPYEKLEMYGENTLSNAELLAIIIKKWYKRGKLCNASTKNTFTRKRKKL